MSESYYCHLNHFQVLIGNLKNAQKNNDTERIKEVQKDIENFKRQCGVPISDEQLSKIIRTTNLNDVNLSFLKTSPPVILRYLKDGDGEHASLLYNAIKQIINRHEKRYTIRNYQSYEILPNGSQKLVEPERQPKIPDPISDVEIIVRNMEEDYRQKEFPEICSEQCPHTTCAYHNEKHYGQPCEMRFESKKNEPDIKARMLIPTQNTQSWINPELKSSLRG